MVTVQFYSQVPQVVLQTFDEVLDEAQKSGPASPAPNTTVTPEPKSSRSSYARNSSGSARNSRHEENGMLATGITSLNSKEITLNVTYFSIVRDNFLISISELDLFQGCPLLLVTDEYMMYAYYILYSHQHFYF